MMVYWKNRPRRLRCWLAGVLGVGLVLAVLPLAASAQLERWNQRTRVTFSAPVEVPGPMPQILPAGTYVFRLLNSMRDRHIVQIFNADETRLYSTVLAIPNYRRLAGDQSVITFQERAAGQPPAIQAWFYPGEEWGHEFVYPKERAMQLAALAAEPVLFVPEEAVTAAAEAAPAPAPTAPAIVALTQAPVRAVDPAGEEVPVAEVVQSPPVQVASLPKTASELPLVALLGLVSTAAGLSLRRVSCSR